MGRIFVGALLIGLVGFGLWMASELVARFRNRQLRAELKRLRKENDRLVLDIQDLRQAEPERLQQLRTEVAGYSELINSILTTIARRRNTLDLGPIEDTIINLIEARRPKRDI